MHPPCTQTALNHQGVTDVVLQAIATHRPGLEGNMADEGIELLMEMLNAGNTDVQLEVYDYITNVDR